MSNDKMRVVTPMEELLARIEALEKRVQALEERDNPASNSMPALQDYSRQYAEQMFGSVDEWGDNSEQYKALERSVHKRIQWLLVNGKPETDIEAWLAEEFRRAYATFGIYHPGDGK